MQKLSAIEKERESEVQQIAFLERQLEDQRASSASESRRAESALEEASRCRDRYDNEHDRAQILTGELSELRHAHLKLSEKVVRIIMSDNLIILKTNKNTYQTKKLMLSHGFIPCEIIGKDGKKILNEKKINQRPSLDIITKTNSKINKKYFYHNLLLFY